MVDKSDLENPKIDVFDAYLEKVLQRIGDKDSDKEKSVRAALAELNPDQYERLYEASSDKLMSLIIEQTRHSQQRRKAEATTSQRTPSIALELITLPIHKPLPFVVLSIFFVLLFLLPNSTLETHTTLISLLGGIMMILSASFDVDLRKHDPQPHSSGEPNPIDTTEFFQQLDEEVDSWLQQANNNAQG